MHLYQYSLIRAEKNGANYKSGSMMLEQKIETNADYAEFVGLLKRELGITDSVVILSLNLLHSGPAA